MRKLFFTFLQDQVCYFLIFNHIKIWIFFAIIAEISTSLFRQLFFKDNFRSFKVLKGDVTSKSTI